MPVKRFLLVLIVAAAAAFAISYGLRHSAMSRPAAVAGLLPRETILFVHFPDFNRTRDQWRDSDIYKLYREPAVQDFLHRPLTKLPQHQAASETLREIEKLAPKDAFIGVTSVEDNHPKILAGFRFHGRRDDVDRIIGRWRAQLPGNASKVPPQTVQYGQHQIDLAGIGLNQSATVYNGDWFFAANDIEQLKSLLDRVDHRAPADTTPTLEAEKDFRAAIAHMPANYVLLFYVQPRKIAEKFSSLQAQRPEQLPSEQRTILEQMRSICGTTRFDGGKLHDVFFVGIPKLADTESLTRSSVHLGTKDTFFYLATLLNVEKMAGVNQPNSSRPFARWLHKVFDAASRNGVTAEDWKAAFALELESVADWPAGARWPSLILTLPVKDATRATRLVSSLTTAIDEDGVWTKTERDGVQYFSTRWSLGNLISATPTIAFSGERLIGGLDPTWVDEAMRRSRQSSSEFARSASYRDAARALPTPTNFFAYVDMALIYSRLDATLRPLLLMGAAFMPAISDHIEVNKLPPLEVVTKHLSPIVSSQRYDGDGYLSESVGPITLNQAAIVLGVPTIVCLGGHNPWGLD